MKIFKNRKGIILVLALAFFALFAAITILSVNTVVANLKLMKHLSYSVKAFYMAEAGAHKALYEMRRYEPLASPVYDGWLSWSSEGSYIDWGIMHKGYYEVGVTATDGVTGNKTVVSTGYFPQKTGYLAKRAIEAVLTPPSTVPSSFFDAAITAGDNVDIKGNSYTIDGDIIYGDTIHPAGLGTQVENNFYLLDFEQLKAIAESQIKPNNEDNHYDQADIDNGKAFPASFWFDEDEGIPNVVYIETNLVLNGNIGTIGGFFVVAGNVITNPDPNAVDADTTINGNGQIDGCIYTIGDFRINGGGNGLNVLGSVWGRDDVRLNGGVLIDYNQVYTDAINNMNLRIKPKLISWREVY